MNFIDYGPVPNSEGLPGVPARITAQHKGRYEIACEYGLCFARLKPGEYFAGSELFPTVGDYVMIRYIENGDSQILATLPRRSFFSRREPGAEREQAVAANFDDVFILQSMNANFNPKRLERYLTIAWQSGATPLVVLTKADLAEDPRSFLARAEQVAVGVELHAVSAHSGAGLEKIRPYLQPGKTVVFLGSSGVGKSSLVNALAGEAIMAVGGIREEDARGRHTTTHRQLLLLNSGALVIDTPGMRELGMWSVDEGLQDAFSDVEQFFGRCRFADCSHEREPGCAIREAISAGTLEEARWQSYQKLKAESIPREALLRRKQAWSKDVAKNKKQREKTL